MGKSQAGYFHTIVAKAMFLSNIMIPKMQHMIPVWAITLRSPNIIDCNKLVRVLKYLNGTRGYHLTLSIDDIRVTNRYVDALFEVHTNLKSLTGGIIMWVAGETKYGLMMQNPNTRSIMEAKVAGVDDMASNMFWVFLFRIKDTMLKIIFCMKAARVISSWRRMGSMEVVIGVGK